jgi:hypothetical protein
LPLPLLPTKATVFPWGMVTDKPFKMGPVDNPKHQKTNII